uniref:Uncharacterized protein n=1 Tax=mine drainage metagenome TaxID=410659 RepID=E6QKU5_9ZZZZ
MPLFFVPRVYLLRIVVRVAKAYGFIRAKIQIRYCARCCLRRGNFHGWPDGRDWSGATASA